MEHEGLLPYTQESATGFCPEPDDSIHTPMRYFFKVHSNSLGLHLIEILNVYTRSCY
jgi:hypothetical protein